MLNKWLNCQQSIPYHLVSIENLRNLNKNVSKVIVIIAEFIAKIFVVKILQTTICGFDTLNEWRWSRLGNEQKSKATKSASEENSFHIFPEPERERKRHEHKLRLRYDWSHSQSQMRMNGASVGLAQSFKSNKNEWKINSNVNWIRNFFQFIKHSHFRIRTWLVWEDVFLLLLLLAGAFILLKWILPFFHLFAFTHKLFPHPGRVSLHTLLLNCCHSNIIFGQHACASRFISSSFWILCFEHFFVLSFRAIFWSMPHHIYTLAPAHTDIETVKKGK